MGGSIPKFKKSVAQSAASKTHSLQPTAYFTGDPFGGRTLMQRLHLGEVQFLGVAGLAEHDLAEFQGLVRGRG